MMKCAAHIDRDAVGSCCSCGRFVCPECKVELEGQLYCNQCMEVRLKRGSFPGGAEGTDPGNSSGSGAAAQIPAELRGWNWGAFLLTWIWGIGNNVWVSLVALGSILPYIGWIVGLVMAIILGIRGNEWAWQHKRWESIAQFRKAQRTWMWWGIGFIAMSIVLFVSIAVLIFALIMIAAGSGLGKQFDWRITPWQ